MATSTEKTILALRSISIGWLIEKLFRKYAPIFSDSVDWLAFKRLTQQERKDESVVLKNRLRDISPAFHNDLCGALNLLMIAAKTKRIKSLMDRLRYAKNSPVAKRFGHDILRGTGQDGKLSDAINTATWFCVREEEFKNEWDKIKQMAITEDQKNYNWQWYFTETPIDDIDEEEGLKNFENALKGIFKEEKDNGESFPAKALRLGEEKNYIRYGVSTGRDPIETLLAMNGDIERGNDPTANSFLIDYYFKANAFRVAYPAVIDSERVANLFAEFVIGAKRTEVEPKVFLSAMRKYATREECENIFDSIRKEFPEVLDIDLKSMRFTIAENLKTAQQRRELKEANKKRKACDLPRLPSMKFVVYDDGNLFDAMERYYKDDVRKKELMDVFELVFKIVLADDRGVSLLPGLEKTAEHSNTYSFSVTAQKFNSKPFIASVANDRHREILSKLQDRLGFSSAMIASEVLSKIVGESKK